eukprot:5700606-Pleurochrysis_carterae.AAC.1
MSGLEHPWTFSAWGSDVAMPVRPAAVAAFDITIGPRSGENLIILVRRVARWVAASVAITIWRRLWMIISAQLFGDKRTPLRLVELDASANLAQFKVTEHFASSSGECESEVARRPLHH